LQDGESKQHATASALARLYTVNELVALHRFSRRTVIRLYEREPGIEVLERPEDVKRNKRRYRSFRVPHYVYARVKAKLSRYAALCRGEEQLFHAHERTGSLESRASILADAQSL
jgi:hypothetical protein